VASKESNVITSAADAASADARGRTKRYLLLQAVRVLCILGAFLIPGWPKWVVIAAAAILPGIAVLVANQPDQKKLLEAEEREREREQSMAPALSDGSYRTVPGEVVDESDGTDGARDTAHVTGPNDRPGDSTERHPTGSSPSHHGPH